MSLRSCRRAVAPSSRHGSAFIQAYLFPAELFPTAIRGVALGVGNLFGRLGTTLAPLAATAPALTVQLGLGSMSLLAACGALVLPERRGQALMA